MRLFLCYACPMNRIYSMLLPFAAVLCFWSCASANVAIPYTLSPAEIIQRAQEASDRNHYGAALQYYQALLERNMTQMDLVCTAEYEIAFIYYKQGNFTFARERLSALLERFEAPDGEYLPQQFKVLARIVLDRIDEKENASRSLFHR